MQWTPVESSQISEVGYDAETETLGIRFMPTRKQLANGEPQSIYHYVNVPKRMFDEMVGAESVGKYFGSHIKPFPTVYPYTKIN